ncbi:MAG: CRISPR-associated endonuclease Cas3'' [Candidatus Brocadia sp.]|nr:CRISPR-associated endonuclease Cas3'' [Candidatus Brocadia sp.]
MNRKALLAHSARFGCSEQTYKEHVSEVVRRALEFASRVAPYTPFGELFLSTVCSAAEYHDLGKIDEANQKVLWEKKSESLPVDHWDAGTAHLLRKKSIPSALCVYSHHVGIPSIFEEKSKTYPFRVRTSAKNDEKTVREITDEKLEKYIKEHEAEMGHFDNLHEGRAPGPTFLRFALSCLVDADHTDTARHYNNAVPESEILLHPEKRLASLDKYVAEIAKDNAGKELTQKERERNDLRQQIYESCRNAVPSDTGLITCDSPVGTGKTTAVMAHLLKVAQSKNLRRIFVVLPFTNIIDQSVDIYRQSLILDGENPEKVVAAHHHKAEFENIASRVFSFLWNAPITVTTAVQFFETLASNHPASLRKLYQLAGSAIFIDEVHAALPADLWPQAWRWLKELVDDWGCYIVLASGSLNRFWELDEFSNPPLKNIPELVDDAVRKAALTSDSIRINYIKKDKPLNADEICDWIKKLQGPRLIILNTVHSAASVAKILLKSYGNNKKFVEHLSTALAPVHRKVILERIKRRLDPNDTDYDPNDNDWTLVATSCVEAGIDFSFRTAAREFCSLISTIQTAGRINRSGEYGESDLWNFQLVPGESLKEHPSFATSARILKQFFNERTIAPEYCTEAMKREVREKNQLSANNNPVVIAERNRDFPSVNDQFKVIPAKTVTAIIDKDMCERIEQHEKVDFIEFQQKSVSIYSNNINKFALRPLRGFHDLYAWMLDYDQDFLGYMAGVLKFGDIESYVN